MKKVKRVVLFGVDGAGTFFRQAQTPNLDRIFSRGSLSSRVLTEIPSISAQCWGSMLHGVECSWHGLTNAIADVRPYPRDSVYPSVFRVIREAMPGAVLASFCDWNSVNIGIVEDGLEVYKDHAPDRVLVDRALDYIRDRAFTFLFFQFDSVDAAGHRYGYGSAEHLEAISCNDALIGRFCRGLEEMGLLEDTLILVEADHGGTPNRGHGGHHGGATDGEKYVCFYAAGPGVLPGEPKEMLVKDTPAVILHALGIPQPEGWTARVPGKLFRDCPEGTLRPQGLPPRRRIPDRPALLEQGAFLREFADLEPRLYLSFEPEAEFPRSARAEGKLYRQEGFMGCGMNFQDGWLVLPDMAFPESFSLFFWIRRDSGLSGEAPVATAGEGEKTLFVQAAENYFRLRWGADLDMTFPRDSRDGWTHFVMVRDRDRFGISVDFGPFECWYSLEHTEPLKNGTLVLGADLSGAGRLGAVLDDFCICRGILEEAELIRLKEYYRV